MDLFSSIAWRDNDNKRLAASHTVERLVVDRVDTKIDRQLQNKQHSVY